MEKNARRKIISEKSEYVRKNREWNLRDEIQFRWLMLKLKKESSIYYYGVRSRVRAMLEKHGYRVSYIAENCYQIKKAE